MNFQRKTDKSIIVSFILVSILLVIFGALSILKIVELSNITKNLYEHPLAVTRAAQNIKANLFSMHRYMKDVVLSKNDKELNAALENVNEEEKIIFNDFDIVFEKYLGDKSDIQSSYDLFIEWKSIRSEVLHLLGKGKTNEAIFITQNKGYKHVFKLYRSVDVLVE